VMQWQSAHQFPLRRFRAHHASLDQVFHDVLDRNRVETVPMTGVQPVQGELR
ncbi:ABC transporter ATP-binding protein, partial [Klebsiella pneumoniae]